MPDDQHSAGIGEEKVVDLTLRAAVIGLLCVIGITVAGCFSAYLRYDMVGAGHLPRCALYPILVIVALNFVLKKAFGKRGLRRTEMLFIYCTILVMTGIPGQQFAVYFYLGLVGPIYYATPQNQYADPVNGFHKYISDWLVPTKDQDHPAIRWLFEGMPQGVTFTDIPWGMWVRPLLVWTPFAVLIFFVTLCIASMLRKQWVDRERLLFPLMQVPLEVSKPPDGAGSVFKSKLLWVGFAIPVIVYGVNGVHAYLPSFPHFDLHPGWTSNLFTEKPWYVLNSMGIHIYFGMIGIAYILTSDVGFSLWFFYLFERILLMIVISFGGGGARFGVMRRNHNVGAFLALALFYAWVGRSHIADIVRKSFGKGEDVDDSDEPMSYRMAFFGATGGFVLICAWCWVFGMSFIYPIVLFGWYFLALIVLTRIVAEAGLLVVFFGIAPQDFTLSSFGYGNVSPQNATMVQLVSRNLHDPVSSLMPQGLQAMKIAGEARLDKRKLFAIMMVAVVIAVLACHVPSLWVTYKTGVPNLGWYPRLVGRFVPGAIENSLASEQQYKARDVGDMGGSAAFTVALLFMRQRFLWWPFHPLGYVASTTWTMWRYWFAIFVGWAIKAVVTWLGGVRLWRRVYPAAIGMIIGNTFILFTWLIIHFIWPIEGVLIIE